MPGRFKISGDNYVSEWGGDSLNDGSAESPFASLPDTPNTSGLTTVIGTGIYKFAWYNLSNRYIIGDGKVVFDGLNGIGAYGYLLKNIHLKNVAQLNSSSNNAIIEDSFLEDIPIGPINWNPTIRRNILKNVGVTSGTLLNNIFLGSCGRTTFTNSIQGCFFSKDSVMQVGANYNFANLTYNLINGTFLRDGVFYEAKYLEDGSPRPDANPAYEDFATLAPNFYTTQRNFAGDPKFLDLEAKLVEPDSDLLKTGVNALFVGAVKPGLLIPLNDVNFQFTYTRIDTTIPESVAVSSGQPDGEIRITGKISDSLVSSRYIGLRTVFQYFKGATAGTGENHDVPDAVKQLGLLASEIDKPRRLTYWMRTSLDANANQASPSAIWDNDGDGAGNWLLMEVNTEPRHVSAGGTIYGNGDPRGEGQVGSSFNFRAIDIRIVLDNERD